MRHYAAGVTHAEGTWNKGRQGNVVTYACVCIAGVLVSVLFIISCRLSRKNPNEKMKTACDVNPSALLTPAYKDCQETSKPYRIIFSWLHTSNKSGESRPSCLSVSISYKHPDYCGHADVTEQSTQTKAITCTN